MPGPAKHPRGAARRRKEKTVFKKNKKLAFWQDKLRKARAAYADELKRMDMRTAYYEGTADVHAHSGALAPRRATNVRNIVYELLESQVDPTIPMPRVEAIHPEDEALARGVEALLRHEVQRLHLTEKNDIQERTAPTQGGALWQVDWDNEAGCHCALGDVAVTDRHPRQVIPQPGVYEIEQMDYIFVQTCQTKQAIRRKYGVDVADGGEAQPEIRGEGAAPQEELVTQNIAYFRNEAGGIGLFSWVEDKVLADYDDYQALHLKVCAVCGAPKTGEVCGQCGARKWRDKAQDELEVPRALTLPDGAQVAPFAREEQRAVLGPDGLPMLDEATGSPLVQSVAAPVKVPRYKPGRYPLVLRRNVSKYASFLGGSDVDVIRDQQEVIKKCGSKIEEKVLKGGSFVTLPEGLDIETTDKEFKILRIKNPAQRELVSVLNVQPDITKDRVVLVDSYDYAKSTLGITDAFQGKYDSSATSGSAKQFSANQSAGRLFSKREQKNSAFARLYELMFRFLLAYADEPIPYSVKTQDGSEAFAHFDRWDFLRRDAAGQFYWNDEYIFSVDPSATLSSNRSVLWEQMDMKLQSGAFGPVGQTQTMLLYWTLMAKLDYPHAGEVSELLRQRAQAEQAQAAGMAGGAPGMGAGGMPGMGTGGMPGMPGMAGAALGLPDMGTVGAAGAVQAAAQAPGGMAAQAPEGAPGAGQDAARLAQALAAMGAAPKG